MIILVTGAFGFIGSNFVEYFKKRNPTANIIVSDYLTNGKQIKNLHVSNYVNYVHPDEVLNSEFLRNTNVDHVFHFGAVSNTEEWDGELVMARNVRYSHDLILNCHDAEVKLTYMSSASVYGNGDGPLNLYATSKYLVDKAVESFLHNYPNARIRGYRLFNVYSESGQDREWHKGNQASVMYKFKKQADETGAIKLFEGSENFKRDFIDVQEVCEIIYENVDNVFGIFDLGTGYQMSFKSIADVISIERNCKVETIPFPEHLREYYQTNTKANMDWMNNEN